MKIETRKDLVYTILGGFFIANALTAEMIGGKIINVMGRTLSVGIIPWPFVFLLTDVINEHFGKEGVRRLTIITAILIAYAYVILLLAIKAPIDPTVSPVDQKSFETVFGTSMWIIVGSITAFLISQLIDVLVFWFIRSYTGKRLIWARATGSTIVSQFIDTFVVSFIAFVIPGKMSLADWLNLGINNYVSKLIIAVLITPGIYVVHWIVDWYLRKEEVKETETQ